VGRRRTANLHDSSGLFLRQFSATTSSLLSPGLLTLGPNHATSSLKHPSTAKECLQNVRMAAAVAAAHAAVRKSGMGINTGLGEATHFELASKTMPPVDERVLAGELSRQIVSVAVEGTSFKKRFVVLSKSSILIGTTSDELLYDLPLLEIQEVKEKLNRRSPSAGRFHRTETQVSWSQRVAPGLVDLVNNEPKHFFVILTKLDGSESGRYVFHVSCMRSSLPIHTRVTHMQQQYFNIPVVWQVNQAHILFRGREQQVGHSYSSPSGAS